MNLIHAQTSEAQRVTPVTLPSAVHDSASPPDTLSVIQRSQSTLGNAAVAGAAINKGPGEPSALPAQSAMQPGLLSSNLQQMVGNSAIQRALRSASIQAKLAVSQPGDVYEQEADQVAKMVMRMPAPTAPLETASPTLQGKCAACQSGSLCQKCAEGQGTLQRKPLFTRITSFVQRQVMRNPDAGGEGKLLRMTTGESPEVSESMESHINSARGGGQPLSPSARAFFEPRFGMDFGHVRVHTGGDSEQMSSAVGARAFSHGSDIYYGPGNSPSDLELTAHELTHVVQQSGGSAANESSLGLKAAEPSIQRAVRTLGGEWNTTKYAKNAAANGVDIDLVFTPEDPVDAELIGLSQTHRGVSEGSPWFPHGTAKGRSTPDNEKGVEGGAQIDQLAPYRNPLYATGATGAADKLATTPTPEPTKWGVHGWHYRDATGTPQHQDALLIDKPWIGASAKNSKQTFETTALAVKGNQEGTYYGSVTWGWQTDASGSFSTFPLALGTVGVPSATYRRAAELWNAGKTSIGTETLDLPVSSLPSSTTLPASRTTSDLVIQIAKITAELASMLPGTDKTNKEFEKKAMEAELAKRADQPTLSLADREKAAALLSTPDLIKRSDALPAEIARTAASSARTDKELEREAVKREIAKRKVLITVHVHETEDVIGSDSVYVTATSGFLGTRTSVVDLNNGQEHTFSVPLSDLFFGPPLSLSSSSLYVRAYDEDWEGDDLMFYKAWVWSGLPAEETQSRDGGKYTVRVDFAQLR